jgi:hypothetical protein
LKNTRTDLKGGKPDISYILIFDWLEPDLYLDPISKFPETTKRPRYFVFLQIHVGDELKFMC